MGDYTNAGAVYVYEYSSDLSLWLETAYLTASNPGGNDNFGHSLGIHENTMVIGARREAGSGTGINPVHNDDAEQSGAVYVFENTNDGWVQQAYIKPSNTDEGDQFGISLSVLDEKFLVGAWQESSNALGVGGDEVNNTADQSGAAYLFEKQGGLWQQSAYIKASNTEEGDGFGFATVVTSDLLLVGAMREDSGSVGVNGSQDNNDILRSGAVYVFSNDLIFMNGFE